MTAHTLEAATLVDSGYAPLVHARFTITVNLGSREDVTVSSTPAAPALGNEAPPPTQLSPGGAAPQIDDLVSDADEFTSVPSAAATTPVTGGLGTPPVLANGAGNGHTTVVG